MLATYIFEEGPWPAPNTEHFGLDFGPNTACLIHRVTRCRGYSQTNPPFGKEICHHTKWDQISQVQESAGSAVGDVSIHQGDQAAIQGGQGKQKCIICNVFDG